MTQPNAITTIQQSDMETCDDEMVFTALIKKIRKYVMILKQNEIMFHFYIVSNLNQKPLFMGAPKMGTLHVQ